VKISQTENVRTCLLVLKKNTTICRCKLSIIWAHKKLFTYVISISHFCPSCLINLTPDGYHHKATSELQVLKVSAGVTWEEKYEQRTKNLGQNLRGKGKQRDDKGKPEVKIVHKYKNGQNKDKKGVLGVPYRLMCSGEGKKTIFYGGGYDVRTELYCRPLNMHMSLFVLCKVFVILLFLNLTKPKFSRRV
jgi:hypothetical protein